MILRSWTIEALRCPTDVDNAHEHLCVMRIWSAFLATAGALEASRRSDGMKSACPPALRILAIVFSPRSTFRPTTSTWTPSWANLFAVARPIPLVSPLMSAVVAIERLLMLSSARNAEAGRPPCVTVGLHLVLLDECVMFGQDRAK